MKGILVTNHYLTGKKFDDLHHHLISTARDMGIVLRPVSNMDVMLTPQDADMALFWDKDVRAAELLESSGMPVFNSSRSIALCDDKACTYTALLGRVPQPRTIIAPLSFGIGDHTDFVTAAVAELGLPVVYKAVHGSFGAQVHLCYSVAEVMEHIGSDPFILQEYIDCGGTDIRLQIVGDECVAAMRRHNADDFRSNITNGGTAQPYTPTRQQVDMAVRACRELGLAFGGVDIIGDDMVCEVNSNAHIINLMECTGIDAAPYIFDYIKERI